MKGIKALKSVSDTRGISMLLRYKRFFGTSCRLRSKNSSLYNEIKQDILWSDIETSKADRLLKVFSQLPEENKYSEVQSNYDNKWLHTNLKFELMLDNVNDRLTPLDFIFANIETLNSYLLERFLLQNIGNKSDFTSMVRVLEFIIANKPEFIISNELWSIYLATTCELFSLDGAKLIFHNLIDNFTLYDEGYSSYNSTQTRVPFLVNPNALSNLVIIFQRNVLPDHIIVVREYFKRYYSIYGHADTLKDISIALVEAFSLGEHTKNTLGSFKYLGTLCLGHDNLKNPQERLEEVHTALVHAEKWRVENIQTSKVNYPSSDAMIISETDRVQLQYLKKERKDPYNPPDAKNNNTRVIPTIEGSLQLNDLPEFNVYIGKLVETHMNSKSNNKIFDLVQIIRRTHFSLAPFIIASLANHEYLREAYAVMKKFPVKHLDVMLPVLLKDDVFIVLLNSCKKRLITDTVEMDPGFYNLTEDIIQHYLNVNLRLERPVISSKVIAAYLSVVIESPKWKQSFIHKCLTLFGRHKTPEDMIYLPAEEMDKLKDMIDLARVQNLFQH